MIIVLAASLQAQWSNDPNNNLIVGYGLDPHICSDSAGGCYVSYDYHSTSYPRWLALERLDRYGYKPWGINKRILGETPEQSGAEIIEDGEGGVIVSYEDYELNWPNYTSRIRVQKVDSIGNFLWGQTGAKVTLEEINHGQQHLVSDGSGGCVITWKTVSSVFYVNKVNGFGERVWGDSGRVLGISHYSGTVPKVIRAADGFYYVETGEYIYRLRENGEIVRRDSVTLGYIVPDPDGGIVLSGRVWNGMIPKLVAQRKDSLGNNLWQEPYVEIADSLYINAIINVKRINNYYYYTWHGRRNGIDLVAQYQALRSNGTKLFNQDNLPISNYPVDALLGDIIPSESETFVMIWQDYRPDDGVFGQRRDTLNNPFWNVNDIPLYTGSYSELHSVTDCAGGAIGLGWHQFDFSIRAFKVSKNGILGEVIIPVELISFFANLIKDKVELIWQTATETNNSGFEILRGVYPANSGAQNDNNEWERIGFIEGSGTTTKPKTYSFVDEDVTTGIYKYKLKQIDFDGSFEYSHIVEVAVGIPTEYLLEQNFPNPFNSSTIIKYQIPKVETHRDASPQLVKLIVYDVLGNEVATLVNEEKLPGVYEVEFNASSLASGIYLYKIQAGQNFIQTKKMILLK